MTVPSALLFFLLFPAVALFLDGSPSPTEAAQEISTTTVDPCICSDERFDENEIDGYIKNLEGCKKEYSCNFIVEPKKGHVVSINVQQQTSKANVYLYYYKGSTEKKDMIFVTDIAHSENTIQVPEGYGIFIKLNGTTEKNSYYWYDRENFQAKFERYNKSEVSDVCPQPVLTVNSTVQTIKAAEWVRAGCAFRVSSPNPIHIRANCGVRWMNAVRVSVNFANQTKIYKSETAESYKILDWDLPSADFDLFISEKSYYSFGGCTVNYFSLDYNPCNCSETNFNLILNNPITLSSPGYPRLLCNNLKCHYNLTIDQSASVGNKAAFVVSALHRSRATGDRLVFNIDKKSAVSLDEHNSNMTESAVYVGNLLEIDYTASSLLSDDHGFIANITAVHIPNDCLCPSSLKKELDGNTFSMDIKPHCQIMNCKFTIPNKSSQFVSRTFRMELDHYLPQDGESLDIIAGDVLYEHYHDDEYKALNKTKRSAIDYVTSSGITIQYTRFMTNNISSDNSRFNMTWKWMTSSDCKCDLIHDWAEPESRTLYSPGYPQRYCSSMNCTYHLEAHEGSNIEMNVTFFETEPHRDYLTFFDGAPSSFDAISSKLKRLDGYVKKSPVIRAGSNVTLVFTSDSNVNNKGFVIKYRSVAVPLPTATSVASHWIVVLFLAVVFVAAVIVGGVVVYKKKAANKPFESIVNPIYGYSNVQDVLVIPSTE